MRVREEPKERAYAHIYVHARRGYGRDVCNFRFFDFSMSNFREKFDKF